jgi:hypothetical protein
MQPHPQAPQGNVQSVIASDPHRYDAPQCDREPQSEVTVRQTTRKENDRSVDWGGNPCA